MRAKGAQDTGNSDNLHLSGSVTLTLDRPVWAYNVRVVFKCEEEEDGRNKETSTIFQIESCIWGNPRSGKMQNKDAVTLGFSCISSVYTTINKILLKCRWRKVSTVARQSYVFVCNQDA